MGKLIYLMGKSSSGKDTIYKRLLCDGDLSLKPVVIYTTRPIRAGETNGVEYFFTDEEGMKKLEAEGKIIERRSYNTFHGVWHYFTVNDEQFDFEHQNLIVIGTLESYIKTKEYFGEDRLLPVMIDLDDGIRLQRALDREKSQEHPKYQEMCRRFLADAEDFSEEKQKEAGTLHHFYNGELEVCLKEIRTFLRENLR